jgi:hypothetical protein
MTDGAEFSVAGATRFVGARAFNGTPYDGHALTEHIEQARILMQDTGINRAPRGSTSVTAA